MVISKTPLRISFVGGGTDIDWFYRREPGAVVSTAIDKYVYVFLNRKFEDSIRVSYSVTEFVSNVSELKHNVIREALRLAKVKEKIDIAYMGDIMLGKAGTGLGSSSSLAVGTLNALHAYCGRDIDVEELARQACKIEIEVLGHPIGKQDQYIAAYGGFRYIQFNPDESVCVEPIATSEATRRKLRRELLMFYTGLSRSSSKILKEQKKNVNEQKGKRNSMSKMAELARQMKDVLSRGDTKSFGELLHENWKLKRKLADGISTPKIDRWYNLARKNGAIGGKICGAGGGGFLLLYVPPSKHNKVISALSNLRLAEFSFEPQGSKIIYPGN